MTKRLLGPQPQQQRGPRPCPHSPACSHARERQEAWRKEAPHALVLAAQRLPAALAASLVSLTASAGLLCCAPQPLHAEPASVPFLKSQGARGILADEEARLFKLRQDAETEVRKDLQKTREALEDEARLTAGGKLCATPLGVDIVGITEAIALTGALVGGFSARQRKAEVERLNDQLRRINLSLRQQARAGTVYAPGLNYAPVPLPRYRQDAPQGEGGGPVADMAASASIGGVATLERPQGPPQGPTLVRSAVATPPLDQAAPAPPVPLGLLSLDEEDMTQDERSCVGALREGKRLLKERQGSSAMVRFERALMLAKQTGSQLQERRATRGLAAAARLLGQHRAAIAHLERVLELGERIGDHVGDADALGTIADIFTEMGDLEAAGKYYDRYIEKMSTDGPV